MSEHLTGFERWVTVEIWNRQPVLESPSRPLLEVAGFIYDYLGMTWHRR